MSKSDVKFTDEIKIVNVFITRTAFKTKLVHFLYNQKLFTFSVLHFLKIDSVFFCNKFYCFKLFKRLSALQVLKGKTI